MTSRRFDVVLLLCGLGGCTGSPFSPAERELVDDWTAGGTLTELTELYATPHSATVAWDATSLDPNLNGYMLWYGTSEAVVQSGGGEVWDVEADMNLGWRSSPYGPGLVQRTTLTGLAPGTAYFIELWARYRDGRSEVVAEGQVSTPLEPSQTLMLFTETEGVILSGFESNPEAANRTHSGSRALWLWTRETSNPVNGILGGLDVSTGPIAGDRWNGAYFEAFLALGEESDAGYPVPYVEVQLTRADGPAYEYVYPAYAVLANTSGWQRIQIPLAAILTADGTSLAIDRPASLSGFLIGARWPLGRILYVDDVVIRH
jgi:hypothetical protein